VEKVLRTAEEHVRQIEHLSRAAGEGVEVKLLYFALNDPEELHDLEGVVEKGRGAVLSGAVMLGRTRLIDNLVFDFDLNPKPSEEEQ
jgi:pantoate--beta-alanine ligase